eukprot:7617955-Pyramimonas_sp.AAC.1
MRGLSRPPQRPRANVVGAQGGFRAASFCSERAYRDPQAFCLRVDVVGATPRRRSAPTPKSLGRTWQRWNS